MPLPVLKPMLATERPTIVLPDGWAVEPKLAGSRMLVYVDDGLWVRTRRGRDVTGRLPELHDIAGQLPPGTILDGELVAGKSKPGSLSRVVRRMSGRRSQVVPLSFRAFDLLAVNGVLVTDRPYRTRRGLLDKLHFEGPSWCTTRLFTEAGVGAFRSCVDAGLEDLVREACMEAGLESLALKHLDSLYEPGKRSRRWVRVALSNGQSDARKHRSRSRAPDLVGIVAAEAFGT